MTDGHTSREIEHDVRISKATSAFIVFEYRYNKMRGVVLRHELSRLAAEKGADPSVVGLAKNSAALQSRLVELKAAPAGCSGAKVWNVKWKKARKKKSHRKCKQ